MYYDFLPTNRSSNINVYILHKFYKTDWSFSKKNSKIEIVTIYFMIKKRGVIMPITTFAAIDVGSNELSIKIFEVSKKTGIRELDYVRHTIELGAETYTKGKIGHSLVNELCHVLESFNNKMAEYQTSDYVAYATSALREASNNVLILDQIKLRTGIKVKILSNSEQRFLCYKAIALKESNFQTIIQKGTAIVDVGAGSMQISLFNKEALLLTQNIRLGSLRIREILSKLENQTSNFNGLISEYLDNDMYTFSDLFLQDIKIKHIIAVGDHLNELQNYFGTEKQMCAINRERFQKIYQVIEQKSVEEISRDLSISKEQACLVLPTAMIYDKLLSSTKADSIWISGITLCDGIVAEYAEKKEKIVPAHDFTNDIIMAARNIAFRYQCNTKHTKNVEYIALCVFDSIRKLHGLGKRERLLLQIAIILHNCGEYINMNETAENSYKIIMSTEIIGLSHLERELIANLVRFNRNPFPKYTQLIHGLDKETYIKISKLTAILRIANAMDKSHKQKFNDLKISIRDNELFITTNTLEDITLEKGLFNHKADFFEEVYGIRPILKQKRSI